MAGPATFLLMFFAVSLTAAIVAVVLRARSMGDRWAGWQALAAARGLQAVDGDPLGLGPMFSGSAMGTSRVVKRTLSGVVDGTPVAVILTAGLTGSMGEVHSRTDLYGLARVGAPVPVDPLRSALANEANIRIGAVGDLAVLEPVRGLRLSTDHPPPEEAARLLDLAALAGRAAVR